MTLKIKQPYGSMFQMALVKKNALKAVVEKEMLKRK